MVPLKCGVCFNEANDCKYLILSQSMVKWSLILCTLNITITYSHDDHTVKQMKRSKSEEDGEHDEDDQEEKIVIKQKVASLPPNAYATTDYRSAFGMILDKEGMNALLIREKRGSIYAYNLLGGKINTSVDLHSLDTVSREIAEESKGMVGTASLDKYKVGDSDYVYKNIYFEKGRALGYLLGLVDSDEEQVVQQLQQSNTSDLHWVDISLIQSERWRVDNMHFVSSVIACKLLRS